MTDEAEINQRADEKSAKRKEARDKMMAGKTIEKGLLIVHTGKGKGKSTAAFGMVMRCIGHGMKVGVIQFIKGKWDTGERWVEGTIFEHGGPRLVLVDGVPVEAPLSGAQIVIKNYDQPGVIGAVGTVLGRHGVNIANFALGRGAEGALGVVSVDEADRVTPAVLAELRAIPAVRSAELVRL